MFDTEERFDVVVVGAGPAGLAAATTSARQGASTLLIDENAAPGGQIYRGLGRSSAQRRRILGADYTRGLALIDAFHASGAHYRPDTTVWTVTPEREVGTSSGGAARLLSADRLILSTGALERPMPIPGWTLPGVMSAGAGQILLKTAGLVADGAVLAGTGPLLWLLANQYLAAGGRVAAILDTTPPDALRSALPLAPAFLRSGYLLKGMRLLASALRHIPIRRHVTGLRAEGDGRLERVAFRSNGGPEQIIPAEALFLHDGILPNVNMADSIGCTTVWDEAQACLRPNTDAWQRSSVDGVWIAGDGARIQGAEAAASTGRLAALDALMSIGRLSEGERDRMARPVRQGLAAAQQGRAFLDAVFRSPAAFERAPPEMIVCRCEEVSAGQIRDGVEAGCVGPNQLKAFLRCGMGPCQGRMCGPSLTCLIAAQRGISPAAVGGLHQRSPVKPITLGELASLPKTQADIGAVVRF